MTDTQNSSGCRDKVGWRIDEWTRAIGGSRSATYNLLKAGIIASVKMGRARVITTPPQDYLATLVDEAG
jgi:hypothetical protein